jgi:hypothetical protein
VSGGVYDLGRVRDTLTGLYGPDHDGQREPAGGLGQVSCLRCREDPLPKTPYIFLDLPPVDPGPEAAAVAELLLQAGPRDLPRSTGTARPGIAVSDAPDELPGAVVRLLRLLDRPRHRKALTPLVKREILWRLLTGEHGDVVRQLGLADSSLTHIRTVARWIWENYASAFRGEAVAQLSG